MKVSIIGGGPGGLYFALLAKKAWPRWEITVCERNRPDDTFGFGVVFSDQTLDTFKACDLVTYERIRRRFAYWGDVDVAYKGQVLRSGGNGFCGCSRVALLNILQDRARDLGVQMRFQREVEDLDEFPDSDLVVIADGINSKFARNMRIISSRASTCAPTSSPGWARRARWTPSSISSARRRRASSSRTATSTRPTAPPG